MSKKEYDHEISQRIKKRFETRYGTKKAITINVVLIIIVNIILYLLFLLEWGQDAAIQQIVSFLGMTVVLEILIIVIFWAIWRFFDIPAEINEEQIEKIRKLTEAANELKIDFEMFPRYSDGYASIRVHNRGSDDINECTLSLLNAQIITKNKTESILEKINPESAYISWGGGNTKKNTIIGKSVATFNLAKCDGENILFLFDDGSQQHIAPGLYRLRIAFDGKMNGKRIKRKCKTCFLEYQIKVIEIPIPDGDEINYSVKNAMYIDIRTTKESTRDIEPSQLIDLKMDAFIRYVSQHERHEKAQKLF